MTEVFAMWRWEYLWADRQLFVDAFIVTVKLAVGGLILALVFGFTVGIASTLSSKTV